MTLILFRSDWVSPSVCVSRRFLLEQGSPEAPKQRPIDDYRDSGVNSAYHALDKLALHDVDYIAHVCQSVTLAVQGHDITFTLSSGEKLEGSSRATKGLQ